MASAQLSSGCIQAMWNGQTPSHPIVQIIDCRKVTNQNTTSTNTADRYRLIISDSIHYQQAMLATQLNDLVKNNIIANRCVIKLNEYLCNTVHGRKIIILLNVETVSQPLPATIGNPVSIDQSAPAVQPTTNNVPNAPQQQPRQVQSQSQPSQSSRSAYSSMASAAPSTENVHPIKSLNPYQNRWTIKARVTAKSEIRTWQNAKGTGKLFSIDLLDSQGGEIRATMFQEAVDRFFPILEVDKVFLISKGSVKPANKKFSSINNEYELTLNNDTIIQLCQDQESDIPKLQFNFVQIADIQNKNKDETIDVIGVVMETSPATKITSKAGKDLTKRSIKIVDMSLNSIEFTLWGAQAEQPGWHDSDHPVLAIKGAKVSDFHNRSLTSVSATHMEINPDIGDAHSLRGWYDSQGGHINATSLTQSTYGNNDGMNSAWNSSFASNADSNRPLPTKTFAQIKDEALGRNKPETFMTKGTITVMKRDTSGGNANSALPWYPACSNPSCGGKKVTLDPVSQMYHCAKCDTNSANCDLRYILSFAANDHTANSWLSSFNEVGLVLLGQDAQHMSHLRETNPAAYETAFQEAMFKQYKFKIRAAPDTYKDEARVRLSVVSATPINFVSESQALINSISQYA